MTERAYAYTGGRMPGLGIAPGSLPDDSFVRPDTASITTGAPFAWTNILNAPDNVTAELKSNSAHCTDQAGNASCMALNSAMGGNDHTVYVRLGTMTWTGNNDNVGVCARAPVTPGSFYSFCVVYNGGVAQPFLFYFAAGAFSTAFAQGGNLPAFPAIGDIMSLTITGTTLTGKLNGSTVVTGTDSNVAAGTRGGIYLQQDTSSNFRITGIWLNHAP